MRFDEGRQLAAERRFKEPRFGRQDGWKAWYRRSRTPATEGPLVIASLADLFESESGAEDALAEQPDLLDEGNGFADGLDVNDAVELTRKQAAHIVSAAS